MPRRWSLSLSLAMVLAMPLPSFALPGDVLVGLRGATTVSSNNPEAMGEAISEMVEELVQRNGLKPEQVVSATFTATADLDAAYPASIARRRAGWDRVSLLDVQQMAVRGQLPRCIRVQLLVWLAQGREPRHAYLRGAAGLRPDRQLPINPATPHQR